VHEEIVKKMEEVVIENANKPMIMENIIDTRDRIRELGKQMKENDKRED